MVSQFNSTENVLPIISVAIPNLKKKISLIFVKNVKIIQISDYPDDITTWFS